MRCDGRPDSGAGKRQRGQARHPGRTDSRRQRWPGTAASRSNASAAATARTNYDCTTFASVATWSSDNRATFSAATARARYDCTTFASVATRSSDNCATFSAATAWTTDNCAAVAAIATRANYDCTTFATATACEDYKSTYTTAG